MRLIVLLVLLLVLALTDLMVGSVTVPVREVWGVLTGGECSDINRRVILDIRLIKVLVALLVGGALSVSGLQMQTVFRNPLAGPYVLGISSGASLGVALVLLGAPLLGCGALVADFGIIGAAWLGAAIVLMAIGAVSYRMKDIMVILILGMMFSSGVGAVVQTLQYLSDEQSLKAYVMWTMGSLGDVTPDQLIILAISVVCGMGLAVMAVKPMNLLLLGEDYARGMGVDLQRWRTLIFMSTTLLAGSVTAFCGPIAFIGLAMPHVARWLIGSGNQRRLLPATFVTGAAVMIGCDIISKLYALPVNSVTSLLGIPIVIWIVVKCR